MTHIIHSESWLSENLIKESALSKLLPKPKRNENDAKFTSTVLHPVSISQFYPLTSRSNMNGHTEVHNYTPNLSSSAALVYYFSHRIEMRGGPHRLIRG